jgi:hypothetical protein
MLYVLRCTLEASLPPRPVEEMEVTLEDGRVVRVYQDLVSMRWARQEY